MTTMTKVSCPAGEWTLGFTASAAGAISVQNMDPGTGLKVRIDASADAEADSLDDPHMIVMPMEVRRFGELANGDVVLLAPLRSASSTDTSAVVALVWA